MGNKIKTKIIGIMMLLLIFPLILLWREMLIISTILIIAAIIYKGVKVLCARNTKVRSTFVQDIVNLDDQTEEYFRNKNLKDIQLKENHVVYEDVYKLKRNLEYEQKGFEAERRIIEILKEKYNHDNIIQNSYFIDEELVTTEVDIIVVDTTGIYIIESKAYSGIIKGNTSYSKWVQLFRGKKYNRFSNPVFQNNRHVKAIKNNLRELKMPDKAFKSYIVFSNNSKLEIEFDKNCHARVIQQKHLKETMLNDEMLTPNIITDEQVEYISKRFRAHADVDYKEKVHHIMRRKNNIKY